MKEFGPPGASLASPLDPPMGAVYTERQHQCCAVASDLALGKLLRFLNKLSESLQQWITTPIDQI